MYRTFYGFEDDPFKKELPCDKLFQSRDLEEFSSRMEYFKRVKGFAVAFGRPGTGKTTCIRAFTSNLNSQLFQVVYLPLSAVTVSDFYRNLSVGLGLLPKHKKVDMFHAIQDHIVNLYHQKKQTPFIILDEAQFLGSKILNELRMVFNFQMDSRNYAMVLLSAQPAFLNKLNLHIHEPLRQRTVVHYEFMGLSNEEIPQFVEKLLSNVGYEQPLFTSDAYEAIAGASSGSPRMVCTLAEKALILGAQLKTKTLDSDIIEQAYNSTMIFES